ncbi:hypothetical protein DFH08DRAFT_714274, partial [Mycena albidolilacea]
LPSSRSNEIIAHILVFPPAALTDEPGTHPEPNWELIGAFPSSPRRTGHLQLKHLFLKITSGSIFPGEHSWTRELHCTLCHPALSWDLAPFLHLRTIRFDRPASIYRLPFIHTSIVAGLKLRGTIWPFFAFRHNLAFPLRFPSQPTIWCGLCNTCCRVRFTGIVPPKLVYANGWGFAGKINYARTLSTLPHLHTVRIVLLYSPRGTHISLDPAAPPDPNAELWVGECERCVGVMYEGPAFRTRYIARKQGVLLPNLTPSAAGADRLYRDPPALERGEWVFQESNRAIGEDASDPGWDGDGGNASR